MKLEKALGIAKEIATQFKRWGKQTNPPYTQAEMMAAIAALDTEGNFDGKLTEELTKTKRQLAASQAREAALKKRLGVSDD